MQTEKLISGEKVNGRIYSLHESGVVAIKKGKHHFLCELGVLFPLSRAIHTLLANREYKRNMAHVKKLPVLLKVVSGTEGILPKNAVAYRGFDHLLK